jgi:SAM-dependent methyltransferase
MPMISMQMFVASVSSQEEVAMTSLVNRFLRWIDENRAGNVVRILKPHIQGATLDVGCWNGDVAQRLEHDDIIGIDVAEPPQPQIEVRRFDGKTIPFKDKQFDTVLCCTALHHVEDQETLLIEMKRVGKRIVILEDGYNHIFDKMSVILLHAIGSRLVGMPYRISGFRSDKQWRVFFEAHGLVIQQAANHPGVQPLWLFLRHHLYVLGAK